MQADCPSLSKLDGRFDCVLLLRYAALAGELG